MGDSSTIGMQLDNDSWSKLLEIRDALWETGHTGDLALKLSDIINEGEPVYDLDEPCFYP